jgi:hypothetical protein
MSAVRDFYAKSPSWNEELHKLLDKEPELRAKFPAIRRAMLDCCGAEKGKSGKVELVVVDVEKWDQLSEQQAAITAKLDAIDEAVNEIDKIFAEMDRSEHPTAEPTVSWIWQAAPRTEQKYQEGEYVNAFGRRVDRYGNPIKKVIDPQFEKWGLRAEKALNDAKRIVEA